LNKWDIEKKEKMMAEYMAFKHAKDKRRPMDNHATITT